MVDFQSRDTRRGADEDDADDEPAADAGEADAEPSASRAASADEVDESAAAGGRGFAVVSVSPDRTAEDDPPGAAAIEEVEAAGDDVVTREVVRPSYDGIQRRIDDLADRQDVLAVVTVGGTGVEPADVTVEAVEPMLDKTLPGFGELVRLQCFETVGTAVVRTRATAGLVDGVPVFCLPGDADLARRSVRDVVVHEAAVIADLAGGDETDDVL